MLTSVDFRHGGGGGSGGGGAGLRALGPAGRRGVWALAVRRSADLTVRGAEERGPGGAGRRGALASGAGLAQDAGREP